MTGGLAWSIKKPHIYLDCGRWHYEYDGLSKGGMTSRYRRTFLTFQELKDWIKCPI
jgi:hypothetical protein